MPASPCGAARGFGPTSSWYSVANVVDHFAEIRPSAFALEDANGKWSYLEFKEASRKIVAVFTKYGLANAAETPNWADAPKAPRPIAIWIDRGKELFAICLAAWRLGLPVVALSRGDADEGAENQRNVQILQQFQPLALISDREGFNLLDQHSRLSGSIPFIDFNEVKQIIQTEPLHTQAVEAATQAERSSPVCPQSVLAYVYTGGTTKASKCVTVTHAMALWEAENYATALGIEGQVIPENERMLQGSSLFWGAAVFGQLSLGLALGGCLCIGGIGKGTTPGAKSSADTLHQIAKDVESFQVTLLGIVPSQLRGAWPGGPAFAPRCLKTLVLWADKCPPELSRRWREAGFKVVDLLIASEYWLALSSVGCPVRDDDGVEKHIYKPLPGLDVVFLKQDDDGNLCEAGISEVGEMHLAGPTTSPGYVRADGHVSLDDFNAKAYYQGKAYLRSRDQLRLLPCGGLVYAGRADSLLKHGGKWMDADAVQDNIASLPGVSQAVIISGEAGLDAFVVLHSSVLDGSSGPDGTSAGTSPAKRVCTHAGTAPFKVLASIRRALPTGCRLHLRSNIPLHHATSKIDRRKLEAELQNLKDVYDVHCKDQDDLERQVAEHFKAWGVIAVGITVAPQICSCLGKMGTILFDLHNPSNLDGVGLRQFCSLVQLSICCGVRLSLLPALWAATTYMEQRKSLPSVLTRCLENSVWPNRNWHHWLPLFLSGCLPLPNLVALTMVSNIYLSWVRERDARLVAGFGGLSIALMIRSCSNLLYDVFQTFGFEGLSGALFTSSRPSWYLSILSAIFVASSKNTPELFSFFAALPGLCFQILPKNLSEDLALLVNRWLGKKSFLDRLSKGSNTPAQQETISDQTDISNTDNSAPVGFWSQTFFRLCSPKWSGRLSWSPAELDDREKHALDRVCLAGQHGKAYWESLGLTVQLHPSVKGDKEVTAVLAACCVSADKTDASEGKGHSHFLQTPARQGSSSSSAVEALVERVCSGRCVDDALHRMDSLQAIQLAEAFRREFGKPVSVADVLRCDDVPALLDVLEKCQVNESARELSTERPSKYRRVWLCGLGPRACTVDWMVCRRNSANHLDISALQEALDCLVERHAALRARNAIEKPMFDATYNAASLWQLHCSPGASATRSDNGEPPDKRRRTWTQSLLGSIVSKSIFHTWPRSEILPADSPHASVSLLRPKIADVVWNAEEWGQPTADDERAFWVGWELLKRNRSPTENLSPDDLNLKQLFRVCVIPIFDAHPGNVSKEEDATTYALKLQPSEVRWYIYAVLDHGYCDGPTGLPLFADLLRLYAKKAGEDPCDNPLIPEADPEAALRTLEKRLQRSLQPLPDAEHHNDDIFHDGLLGFGWRPGYQRHIRFEESLMKLLRFSAEEQLGCSVDVAWLTAISIAFLRLFPNLRRLDLYLIVTCRDGPGEETMVGYFSSRKLLPIEVGDPKHVAIIGLSELISTARKQRSWRRPRPFEKFGAIEVNVVSQVADGLPFGFREVRVPRNAPPDSEWHRGGTSHLTLRLDQTSRDGWDFRMHSHDASFGYEWSSYYAQALGSAFIDMALNCTGPVVPA